MGKILAFICISLSFILAEDFEIIADDVKRQGDISIASGNAMVIGEDMQIFADFVEVNNLTKDAHLKGGVKIYRDKNLFIDTDEITINLDSKQFHISPFYAQESLNGLWMISKNLYSSDNNTTEDNVSKEDLNEKYHFTKASISGCPIQNPMWQIDASSGTYHKKYEFMSVWNPRIYLGKIPIFYLPYLFFPTGSTRKTGLLQSSVALSNKEGFLFSQPFFLAPYDRWDMTFAPQIRTIRGYGLNYEFKIADSSNHIATFTYKAFRNFDSYWLSQKLQNKRIYGIEFDYSTDNILESKINSLLGTKTKDVLYADITYLNDIDYNRLDSLATKTYERLYYSRINYFIYGERNYLGAYFKYALDTSSPTNNASLHTLPNLQYHKFLDSLFVDNILYSLDFQSKNITRGSGYGYIQNSATIPFGINLPLFNALQLSAFINLNTNNINLNSHQDTLSVNTNRQVTTTMNYALLDYSLRANLDLAKRYNSFFHTLHLEGLLNAPLTRYYSSEFDQRSYETYSNLATTLSANNLTNYFNPNDLLNISAITTTLDLRVSQYFYSPSGKELFYYRAYQRVFVDNKLNRLSQNMQNEIGFYPFDFLNLSTSAYYSHQLSRFDEMSLSANVSKGDFNSNLSYYFKLNPKVLESGQYNLLNNHTRFLRLNARYNFGIFRLGAGIGYDVANSYAKDYHVFVNKDMHCWGFGLRFASEVRPVLTTVPDAPIQVVTNNYIRFELRFVPLSGFGLGYRFQGEPSTP